METADEDAGKLVGEDGTSVGDLRVVVRYGVAQSRYDKVSKKHFSLTDDDEKEAAKTGWARYSVYDSALTSYDEAVSMLRPQRRLAIKVPAALARTLKVENDQAYDIKWDWLGDCLNESGDKIADSDAGCEGHCGIHILSFPDKSKMNTARSKLIDLINDRDLFEPVEATFEEQ